MDNNQIEKENQCLYKYNAKYKKRIIFKFCAKPSKNVENTIIDILSSQYLQKILTSNFEMEASEDEKSKMFI